MHNIIRKDNPLAAAVAAAATASARCRRRWDAKCSQDKGIWDVTLSASLEAPCEVQRCSQFRGDTGQPDGLRAPN